MRERTYVTYTEERVTQAETESAVNEILSSQTGVRINETNFSDKYSDKEIRMDLKYVEKMKEKFNEYKNENLDKATIEKIEKGRRTSEAFEISVIYNFDINDWAGKDALIKRATEYDDIYNNVDAIIEFDLDEVHRITITIDASTNPDFEKIKEKIERNIEKLTNKEKQTQVKYFQSQVDNTKGKLLGVIPVVVGAEGKNINKILALHGQLIKLSKQENKTELQKNKSKEIKKELMEHPIQKIILHEMLMQLEMYQSLFTEKEYNKYTKSYLEQITQTIEIINNILLEKKDIKDFCETDGVFEIIRTICKKN
jgi:hypothetical protein